MKTVEEPKTCMKTIVQRWAEVKNGKIALEKMRKCRILAVFVNSCVKA
jgi:hypothetical protein